MKLNKLELFQCFQFQVLRKNFLCLSQSGFSNFALHVIEKMLYINE